MKKVRNAKVGDLVKVPVYNFAPHRSGWNGWLFRVGVVENIYTGQATGRKIACVRYACKLLGKYTIECEETVKNFYLEKVFSYDSLLSDKRRYDECREWEKAGERVCWSEDLAFLAKNGWFQTRNNPA